VLTEACFCNNQVCCSGAIKHSGDSRDGSTEGVDEEITIDMTCNQGLVKIKGIVFVINSYSGKSLDSIQDAKICFKKAEGSVIAQYDIPSIEHCGLVSAVMLRTEQGEWTLQSLNASSKGKNFQESTKDVIKVLDKLLFPNKLNHDTRKPISELDENYVLKKNETVVVAAPTAGDKTSVSTDEGDDMFVG
jgi:stress response protein SCP2